MASALRRNSFSCLERAIRLSVSKTSESRSLPLTSVSSMPISASASRASPCPLAASATRRPNRWTAISKVRISTPARVAANLHSWRASTFRPRRRLVLASSSPALAVRTAMAVMAPPTTAVVLMSRPRLFLSAATRLSNTASFLSSTTKPSLVTSSRTVMAISLSSHLRPVGLRYHPSCG